MTNVILKMENETGPAVSPLPSERNSNEQNFGGDELPGALRSNEFIRHVTNKFVTTWLISEEV